LTNPPNAFEQSAHKLPERLVEEHVSEELADYSPGDFGKPHQAPQDSADYPSHRFVHGSLTPKALTQQLADRLQL
jgi:hypothetical protein